MEFLKKNYLFCIILLLVIFIHQAIFQNFFPNSNSYLGHDYSISLPNLIFGKIWFEKNMFSIPWFSPSFCCGAPFFADPQSGYYSLQQMIFVFFSPVIALKLSFLFFSLISFFGFFFLVNKSFKLNIYLSLLAATLFLFNGFFNYRAIIGHYAFLSYIFIPLYCFILIHCYEKREEKLKSFFYLLISSLLFSNFIHSGAASLIVVISLSILSVLTLYIYINDDLKIIYKLTHSILIGLIISSSKINASFAFLNNFTREYPPLLFKNSFDFFENIIRSLYLYPNEDSFNSKTVNNVTGNLQIHELEFGLSIVPLIIFIIFIVFIKKANIIKFNFVRLLCLIVLFSITVFIISLNLSDNYIGETLRKLPVIKSTWVHYRLVAVYIVPIILISCFLLNSLNFDLKYFKYTVYLFLIIILYQEYNYNKVYYDNQTYDAKNLEKFYKDQNRINNLKVEEIIIFLDKKKKPVITNQRNDMFVYNFSPLFCYNPIFGYNLELLPKNKFTFNSMVKINDNLISYKGNPKLIKNNETNFFNPSCFVFPKENNCIPGDLFKKNQIQDLEKFLNYKKFDFNLSASQKIFNNISLMSLIFTFIFIIYYLVLKIFRKFKNVKSH